MPTMPCSMSSSADESRRATDTALLAATRSDLHALHHKALRHALGHALLVLGRTDGGRDVLLRPALAEVEAVLALVRRHMQQEGDFVHAALEARRPGAASRAADEHAELRAALSALETGLHALRDLPPARRAAGAHQLYLELAGFVALKLRHMQLEEGLLNMTLWAGFGDGELLALHAQVVLNHTPHELLALTQWLAPAATPFELAAFLRCLHGKLADDAAVALAAQVQRLSSAEHWQAVQALLTAPGEAPQG